MTLSAKKLEKLKKKLLNPKIDFEIIPTYSGDCQLTKFKGFEIMVREKVLYSKNPIVSFAQEISALFKKRELPPTEYTLVITKVPHYFFNHLLKRGEKIEYPTKIKKEIKEEMKAEVFGKVIAIIENEIIRFFKNYEDKPERKKQPLSDKGGELSQYSSSLNEMKQQIECPHCGQALSKFALKCEKCGSWVDNDVFRRLCERDVKLIKSRDLVIVTPTLISVMLSENINNWLRKLLKKSKELNYREALFLSYCYSSALNLHAEKKSNKKDLLDKNFRTAIILHNFSLIEKILPYKKKFNKQEVVEFGLDVFNQLDKIINEEILSPKFDFNIPPECQFIAAKRIGDVIYKDKNTIKNSLELYVMFFTTMDTFRDTFSKFFIVEEVDFDWRSIID